MKKHTFKEIDELLMTAISEYGFITSTGGAKIRTDFAYQRAESLPDLLAGSIRTFAGITPEKDSVRFAISELAVALKQFNKLDYMMIELAYGNAIRHTKEDSNLVVHLRVCSERYLKSGKIFYLNEFLDCSEILLTDVKEKTQNQHETPMSELSRIFEDKLNEILFHVLLQYDLGRD